MKVLKINKMKKIVFFCILIANYCFSQSPSNDLFQTWYLVFLQNNDLGPSYTTATAPTAITPTLTISTTLDFVGQGACNSFSGSFSASTNSTTWQNNSFSSSSIVCNPSVYNSFEESYFNFLTIGGWYQITPTNNGLILTMQNLIFGQAQFQNFPLQSNDFEKEQIVIYPNPTNSKLFLNYNSLVISKIELINTLGQTVKIIENDFDTLDVSEYQSGIYLLKIDTESGIIYQRFIKE